MNRSRRWSSILLPAAALAVLLTFPMCSGTKHTVARIVTPAARPTEVFVPVPADVPPPPPPPATRAPQAVSPVAPTSPTPAPMRVVTAPAAPAEQSPGVLYEKMVPTAVPVTPMRPTAIPATPFRPTPTEPAPPTETRVPTPRSTREPRPTATPKPGRAPKPGTYYEDEQGRPLPTPTPPD
jgi:hypothetical protein